jgi:HK97 family phage portal protein
MGLFKSLFRSRDKPQNQLFGGSFLLGGTVSGKAVNERTAMRNSAVYACVRVLSEAVAGLPLHIHRRDGRYRETAYNHPLHRLLAKEPNSEMTSFVFREVLMGHILIYGNAFVQITRNGRGHPTALYPLLPCNMSVTRDSDEQLLYTYNSDKGQVKLRRYNVLHIPGMGFDGIMGYSPITIAQQSLGAAFAVEEYGSRYFANGANPGGVLEFPGTVKDIKRVKESWNAGHQGSANAGKIAVLEEGAKFSAISISPEQSQFLESRKFSINEICRIFRVQPHLIADLERATFSNIEHQSLEFVKYSLEPWVVRWEQSMEKSLLLPSEKSDYYIKFNMDGLLRRTYKERMDGYSTGIQNGFLSPNDVRTFEDLNPIDDPSGDKYYFNGNILPIDMAGAAYLEKGAFSDEEKI